MIVDQSGKQNLKVAICTPCQDIVSAGYAFDLARLVGVSGYAGIMIFQSKGTIIPQQREKLAASALDSGASHILWIDSDMRFPKDSLTRLLEHEEPIVAANYATRRMPIIPTAGDKEHGELYTEDESQGLVKVHYAGMGLMLVETRVFRAMLEPWFALGFNPKEKDYIGEDVYFCKKARESGFRVLVDQELSKEVRHVGEMEFTHRHTNLTREAMTVGT